MKKFFSIKYAVFDRYVGNLRWIFVDTTNTEKDEYYMLSLNPLDIKYIKNGIYFLIPPFKKSNIKKHW